MEWTGGDDALQALRDLSRRGASGELVAAGDELEVHIHLYRGRIAWATSSATRGMLVSHLLAHCDLDRAALHEVVQECRRTRRRFGETLVEWGVATSADVRAALASQVREALGSLRQGGGLRTLFLPRDAKYSEELTFDLGEVWQEPSCRVSDEEPILELGERLIGAIPEVLWIVVLSAEATLFAHGSPRGGEARGFLRSTSQALDQAGARSATLRCGLGTLVGRPLPFPGVWAWCGLPAGANLGLAKAVLTSVAPRASVRPPPDISPEWTTHPEEGPGEVFRIIGQAMDKSEELVTGSVLEPETGRFAVVHRRTVDALSLVYQSSQLVDLMRASLGSFFAPQADTLRLPHTSLHMEDEHFGHFGTSLHESRGPYLWLVMRRSSTPGFGWALLTTLGRQLSEERLALEGGGEMCEADSSSAARAGG
jgi:hypothetical protein